MIPQQDLARLLERVEAASGPDRELDARIAVAFEPEAEFGEGEFRCEAGCYWRKSHGASIVREAIEITASLDAVLALVERSAPRDIYWITKIAITAWDLCRDPLSALPRHVLITLLKHLITEQQHASTPDGEDK